MCMRNPYRLLEEILANTVHILGILRRGSRATRLALEIPSITRRGKLMANFELPNDQVATILIKATNSGGVTEPVPTGDTFTALSSNAASLGAAIGADGSGNPAVVLTPLVRVSPGITVTVSDSAGLAQASIIVDIVEDVTPANLVLDVADATHVSQPVPTAPGP